ncbi:Hsp20/alpha crystallin family protein [Ammoniphilus sp. CFH 90114]|uniref:Hsp20/alpha crystallin family protein n=1 Tax=Ammoniphilus sp. CFH 90114 TaxID=2493665 RepID=UPI00100F6FFD|nr:Hsp20/alpha crystallin family protein [Ammoniphilus sp. CFH 90114]RXT08119.1 Hsp20/alpha crystallin family protein [Ammoniphilus sp. CFH 90114]
MLIHPNESGQSPQIRQGMENDIGPGPYTEYFQRTGPLVDLYETMEEVVVSCEVPGLQKNDDIHIHVTGRHLTLNGIIQRASEDTKDNRYHRTERYFGNFYRTVDLPHKVVEDSAKATYKNGVLEIRMKKTTADQGKKIEVDFH